MTTLPADKPTYTAEDKVIRQTECQYRFLKDKAEFSIRFMGDVAETTQLASAYRTNSIVGQSTITADFSDLSSVDFSALETTGKVTSSIANTKKGCGTANIIIAIPYKDGGKIKVVAGEEPEFSKVAIWSEKSTKWQFPLEVYAGDVPSDSQSFACAGDYAAWKDENGKNADNYKNFKYSTKEGNVVSLSARTLELAKKFYAGIENVERAYPEVIRTTSYQYIHGNATSAATSGDITGILQEIDEDPHLYYIDSSISSVWDQKFPGFSWLKAAYDLDIQPSEYEEYWNATVVESWIGIDETERGPWDANLYGSAPDRWSFYMKDEPQVNPDEEFPPAPSPSDPEYEEIAEKTWIQRTDNSVEGIRIDGTYYGNEPNTISTVLQVDLGDVVTGVASNAFQGYSALKTVYVPTSVTAIASNAFLSGPDIVSFIGRTEEQISSMANYPWGMELSNIVIYEG